MIKTLNYSTFSHYKAVNNLHYRYKTETQELRLPINASECNSLQPVSEETEIVTTFSSNLILTSHLFTVRYA